MPAGSDDWRRELWVAGFALAAVLGLGLTLLGRGPTPDVASAPFTILSAELRFDGGPPRSLAADERVRVALTVEYLGTGPLEGVFEVAGPTADGERPRYRELGRVVRSVRRGQTIELWGPSLPTGSLGTHRVRFRMLNAPEGRELAAAAYAVDAPLALPASQAP